MPLAGLSNWKDTAGRLRVDFQFPVNSTGSVDLIAFETEDLRDCNEIWEGPDDCATLGLESLVDVNATNPIQIFPVPTKHILNIAFTKDNNYTVKIIDILGVVKQHILKPTQNKIDVSKLTPGVYFIKIQHKGDIYLKQFIKK